MLGGGAVYFNGALDDLGALYLWGYNNDGVLGQGNTTNSTTPLQVKGVGGTGDLENIVDFNCSSGDPAFVVACDKNGKCYAWGGNDNGQLGQGNVTNSQTPLQVKGIGGSGSLENIVSVGVGHGHSLACDSTGNVYSWGSNFYNNSDTQGMLGDGTTTNRTAPIKVLGVGGTENLTGVIQVVGQPYTSHALTSTGNVYSWGSNEYGECGDGTTTNRLTPVQVVGVGGTGYLENIIKLSHDGYARGIMALGSNGLVYAWGYNAYGQLGQGDTTNSSTPVIVKSVNGTNDLENIVDIASGGDHAFALDSSGNVYGWGYGEYIGISNSTANVTTPQKLPISNIAAIGAERFGGSAMDADGNVFAWSASNSNGHVGDGTTTNRYTPVAVKDVGGTEQLNLKSKDPPPQISFDGYNKLTIIVPAPVPAQVLTKTDGSNTWATYNYYATIGTKFQYVAHNSDGLLESQIGVMDIAYDYATGKWEDYAPAKDGANNDPITVDDTTTPGVVKTYDGTPTLLYQFDNPYTNSDDTTTITLKFTPTGSTETQEIDIGTATEIIITETGDYSVSISTPDVYIVSTNSVTVSAVGTPVLPNSDSYFPLTSQPSTNVWSSTTGVTYGSDGVTFDSTSSIFGIEFTVTTPGVFSVSCNFLKTSFTDGGGVTVSSSTNANAPELESSFTATSYAFRGRNNGYQIITGLTNNTNQWYHLVWVYDSNNGLVAYIDGVQVYSYTGTITSPQTSFMIGPNYRSDSNKFGAGGQMSDIRIYNTAISSAEAELIYKADNMYSKPPSIAFDNYNRLLIENAPVGTTSAMLHNETSGVSTEVPVLGNTVVITEANSVYSLSVGGTSQYYTKTNSVTVGTVTIPQGYRYLAFWGGSDTVQGPSFQEIELTLGTSLNGHTEIKNGKNDSGVTFHDSKEWSYSGSPIMKDFSTFMNGQTSLEPNRHQYKDLPVDVIIWYMDLGEGVYADVSSGKYWTYPNDTWLPRGKLYGTNINPPGFTDASLASNYTYICDLTRNVGGRVEMKEDVFDLDGNVDGNVEW
tara:strand:- start:72 stop:3176 length:3105 start_codon:yes stop_codon:yes gene_type:complete